PHIGGTRRLIPSLDASRNTEYRNRVTGRHGEGFALSPPHRTCHRFRFWPKASSTDSAARRYDARNRLGNTSTRSEAAPSPQVQARRTSCRGQGSPYASREYRDPVLVPALFR